MDNSRQQRDQYYVKMIMSENQNKKSNKLINEKEFKYEEKLGINRTSNIDNFEKKDVDSIISEIKTDELKRIKAKKEKRSLIIFSLILFILATMGVACIIALLYLIN